MPAYVKNLALVLGSILLTLALLEGVARIFKLGTGGFWQPDAYLGWVNIPNASGWESCYGDCQVWVTINSLGLRDDPVTYEKKSGEKRILFLGDSMTAGMQVALADTFTQQLEGYLQESSPEWEVINGAVNGYGTDNELLFYRLRGQNFQPDIVVLGVYLANDVYNNSRVLELRVGGELHKPYFTLDDDRVLQIHNYPVENTDTFFIRVGSFLKKHFQLSRFVAQTLSLRGEVPSWLRPLARLFGGNRGVAAGAYSDALNETGQTTAVATICDTTYTPEVQEAWDITKALLRQLDKEVAASGARLAVVGIPTTAQTIVPPGGGNWYCQRPNDELAAFLQEAGIPYLDLLPAFRAYSAAGGAELYYESDFHMNTVGHELAGAEIYKFVQEELIDQ